MALYYVDCNAIVVVTLLCTSLRLCSAIQIFKVLFDSPDHSCYRGGISLLSVLSTVYAKIIDSWLRNRTESMVMKVQGDSRSCVNHIFTIRQLSKKILEKNKQMIIACVDLEKVYDKVCREKLWRMLVRYKVDGQQQKAIQSLYRESQACVQVNGKFSRWFPISQGVRQGCVMSPWLFNIYIDGIIREVIEEFVGGVQLSNIRCRCYFLLMIL